MSPQNQANDSRMMRRALALAKRGAGLVSPNPLVGAILTKGGKTVSEGYHHQFGGDHAEIDALRKIDFKADGYEMYVTLEPCSHHGKTPPCADAIIRAGISKLYVAMVDPNPLVAGKGIAKLRRAGIEVELGLLEREARELNFAFIKFIQEKRPFVVAKAATTIDGRIATSTGDSGQTSGGISGDEAHRYVQRLRRDLDAILVGASTVNIDDPRLTCRLKGNIKQPLRVILDGQGESPTDSQVFDTEIAPTLVATTRASKAAWRRTLKEKGVEVLLQKGRKGMLDPLELLRQLGQRQIASLLVEGGGKTMSGFLQAGAIDRFDVIVAPRIIGAEGIGLIGDTGITGLEQAWRFELNKVRRLGPDLLLQYCPNTAGEL